MPQTFSPFPLKEEMARLINIFIIKVRKMDLLLTLMNAFIANNLLQK